MGKHRYPISPLEVVISALGRIIIRLTEIHAVLLTRQGRKSRM